MLLKVAQFRVKYLEDAMHTSVDQDRMLVLVVVPLFMLFGCFLIVLELLGVLTVSLHDGPIPGTYAADIAGRLDTYIMPRPLISQTFEIHPWLSVSKSGLFRVILGRSYETLTWRSFRDSKRPDPKDVISFPNNRTNVVFYLPSLLYTSSMGGLFSSIRFALQTLKTVVEGYDVLSKRISVSPGVPQCNSSLPYWLYPLAKVAHHGQKQELLLSADVVIIGSGITGTSIAKALLEDADIPLTIVMLEARDACSGATGRNGGHIAPNIYNEYFELKEAFGKSVAQDILRFRLAHISTLLEVAKEEGLQDKSQARLVEHIDAFLQPEKFADSQRDLEKYLRDVPKDLREGFESSSERTTIDRLQLATSIVGCIFKPGAAIHPYRLITGLLHKLLTTYSNFYLYTHTPCTKITSDADAYTVVTPRGAVRARHVIHATNAWASHLLPGMRRKIIPTRAHMSAQRPGKGLSPPNLNPATANSMWAGSRAFVFYPSKQENAFDYLTQLLPTTTMRAEGSLPTGGEFMFGGGAMLGGRSEKAFMDNIGISDDSEMDFEVEAYLSGALERYFSNHWGQEGDAPDVGAGIPPSGAWGTGRVKASWTGIIALSADMQPWVGRVPQTVSHRKEPAPNSTMKGISVKPRTPGAETPSSVSYDTFEPQQTFAKPGEWICAGYTGEGMVHAWLSGQAVAKMVLNAKEPGTSSKGFDKRTPDLPKPFLITEKRVRDARVEYLLERVGG